MTKLAHLDLTARTIFMVSFPIFEVLLMLYPTCFASRALRLHGSLISHWPSSMLVFPRLLAALTNHCLCSEKGKSALSKALVTSSSTSTCKYLEGSIWAKTATQHGPSTAVHIYREYTTLSIQQNDISTSHFYPWTKNVVLVHVLELTLLGTDCLHFLTLNLCYHACAMQVFLPCSNHTFWCTVGTCVMLYFSNTGVFVSLHPSSFICCPDYSFRLGCSRCAQVAPLWLQEN